MKLFLSILMLCMTMQAFGALRSIKSTQREMRTLELSVQAGTYSKVEAFVSVSLASATDINFATDTLTSVAHLFVSGDKVRLTTDNTLPAGSGADVDYFVYKVTDDTFQLSTTRIGAYTGADILNMTDAGTGNQAVSLNEVKYPSHGFNDNDRVQLTFSATKPTGLALTTDYWIEKIDGGKLNFRATYNAATPVEWTDAGGEDIGTGNMTIKRTDDFLGLAKFQATVTASETGIYRIVPSIVFGSDANVNVQVTATQDECKPWVVSKAANLIVIEMDDATDGTTPKDCTFDAFIYGSIVGDNY